MKLGEITMRNGAYCRMRIEEASPVWMESFMKKGGIDWNNKAQSSYEGSLEIECQYDGKEISDVAVIFFFDNYEKIDEQFSTEEINCIKEYLHENFQQVPDNADLGLGDVEWYDMAYAEGSELQIKMGN